MCKCLGANSQNFHKYVLTKVLNIKRCKLNENFFPWKVLAIISDQIGHNFAIWATFYRPRQISGGINGLLFKVFKCLENVFVLSNLASMKMFWHFFVRPLFWLFFPKFWVNFFSIFWGQSYETFYSHKLRLFILS